jgi:predicted O-methyltransferase YrrM
MTSLARRALQKVVNGYRLNDTAIYAAYLHLRYPTYSRAKAAELAFYRSLFSKRPVNIFDIGANGGSKTAIFLRIAEMVVTVEPSPAAAIILRQRFAKASRVHIVEMGVGSSEGLEPLRLFEEADAYNTFSKKWVAILTRFRGQKGIPQSADF